MARQIEILTITQEAVIDLAMVHWKNQLWYKVRATSCLMIAGFPRQLNIRGLMVFHLEKKNGGVDLRGYLRIRNDSKQRQT